MMRVDILDAFELCYKEVHTRITFPDSYIRALCV